MSAATAATATAAVAYAAVVLLHILQERMFLMKLKTKQKSLAVATVKTSLATSMPGQPELAK